MPHHCVARLGAVRGGRRRCATRPWRGRRSTTSWRAGGCRSWPAAPGLYLRAALAELRAAARAAAGPARAHRRRGAVGRRRCTRGCTRSTPAPPRGCIPTTAAAWCGRSSSSRSAPRSSRPATTTLWSGADAPSDPARGARRAARRAAPPHRGAHAGDARRRRGRGGARPCSRGRTAVSSTFARAHGLSDVHRAAGRRAAARPCEQRLVERTRQYAKRQQTWLRAAHGRPSGGRHAARQRSRCTDRGPARGRARAVASTIRRRDHQRDHRGRVPRRPARRGGRRRGRRGHRPARHAARRAWPSATGPTASGRERLAAAGDPAALPPRADGGHRARPVHVPRQDPAQGRHGRRARRAARDRAARRVRRGRRDPDAGLRQHRRPRRRRDDGRHLGHRRLRRADRPRRPPLRRRRHRRRARAARRAARDHRGRRLHRLARRSSSRACSSSPRRCSAPASCSPRRRPILDVTTPTGHRATAAACRPARWSSRARAPRSSPPAPSACPCALIIGQRTESTDRKTSLNQALRDFDVAV